MGEGFSSFWDPESQFQKQEVQRHVILEPNKQIYQNALEWKKQFNTDIEILNIFSWEFETDEIFDLVYDDRQEVIDEKRHEKQMNKILIKGQWYASWAIPCDDKSFSDYPIYFNINNQLYAQALKKFGEYLPWQL